MVTSTQKHSSGKVLNWKKFLSFAEKGPCRGRTLAELKSRATCQYWTVLNFGGWGTVFEGVSWRRTHAMTFQLCSSKEELIYLDHSQCCDPVSARLFILRAQTLQLAHVIHQVPRLQRTEKLTFPVALKFWKSSIYFSFFQLFCLFAFFFLFSLFFQDCSQLRALTFKQKQLLLGAPKVFLASLAL